MSQTIGRIAREVRFLVADSLCLCRMLDLFKRTFSTTLWQTNIEMEYPHFKQEMHLQMLDFPASYLSLPECIKTRVKHGSNWWFIGGQTSQRNSGNSFALRSRGDAKRMLDDHVTWIAANHLLFYTPQHGTSWFT